MPATGAPGEEAAARTSAARVEQRNADIKLAGLEHAEAGLAGTGEADYRPAGQLGNEFADAYADSFPKSGHRGPRVVRPRFRRRSERAASFGQLAGAWQPLL